MSACTHAGVPVCASTFIVDECVMYFFFFTALCPRLTVHLLRLGGRWYCHSAREGGGVEGRESWGGEVQKEKEWPSSADSRPLHRSKAFSQRQLTGGKISQTLSDTEKEKEEKGRERAVFKTHLHPGMY